MAIINKDSIELAAKETLGFPPLTKWESKDKDSRIRSIFGASSEVISEIWNRIEPTISEPGAKPKHLLWAFVFMKVYSTEDVHRAIVGWPSAKTFRKWSWYFVQKIAELKDDVIRLDDRFNGYGVGGIRTNSFITVDCTDCPVFEPWPFDKHMYSHKMNGPALKYEVDVSIKTGSIVWINGPFCAGTRDVEIFNNALVNELAEDEVVEVDGGYGGIINGRLPRQGIDSQERKEKSVARGRHEAINGRLKVFAVLTTHFRHMGKNREEMMQKHKICFNAITVITQLKFEGGDKTFDVKYDVNYF